MKKLIPILLCILLLVACAPTYDGPTETVWVLTEERTQHGEDIDASHRIYSYDIYGNLVLSQTSRSGKLSEKTVFTYDDRGNCLTEKQYTKGRWFFSLNFQNENTYDSEGRMLTHLHDPATGEKEYTTYTYEGDTVTTNGSDFYKVERFDEQGRLIFEEYAAGGTWNRFEYTFGPEGQCLSMRHTDSDGNELLVYHEYDAQGHDILCREVLNGVPAEELRREYEYDELGRRVRCFNLADGGRREETRWEYHDDYGSFTAWRDGQRSHSVFYDERGNIIEQVQYYAGTGEIYSRHTYTYSPIQVPAKEATP